MKNECKRIQKKLLAAVVDIGLVHVFKNVTDT